MTIPCGNREEEVRNFAIRTFQDFLLSLKG
jgi:hypothetical protein